MALYTQKSIADFGSDWERIQRKELERQQQEAAAQLAMAQTQAQQAQRPSGLAGVLAGIGESISNVGNTLYDMGGRGINSIADIVTGKVGASDSNLSKWNEQRKKEMGATSDKDYYLKTGGRALDAASTVSDFIPGLGAGVKAGLNVAQGGISGVAREFADNGENATLENAVNNAIAGTAGAAAGQFIGGKLAKNAALNPAKDIIGKAAQSGIGRGAISGAVSGAVGGGVGTGLAGGNVLEGAIQGAEGGALGGATTAALYNVAGAGVNKLKNRIENGPKSVQAQPVNVLADQEQPMTEGQRRRQTALGWDDQQIDASKRNALQKLGKSIEDMGKSTENSKLLGKLNTNTARDVERNDTLNVLKKKYGYTVGDYDKAADLSEATNAWIKNEAKTSGASGYDTKLTDKVSLNNYKGGDLLVDVSDKGAKQYRRTIQQLLDSARVEGGGVDEYSAAALYDAADEASHKAHQYYENSHAKMDGSILASDKAQEKNALSQAYSNFAKEARATANNMLGGEIDEITRNNLVKMLKSSGAPEAAVKTLSKAKTLSELKTMTSPLETARDITEQISQTNTKRGATTSSAISPTTKLANAVGLSQAIDELAAPAGQAVGKIEQGVGKAVTAVGDAIAGQSNGLTGKTIGGIANVAKAATQAPNLNINTKSGPISLDRVMYDQIIRQSALNGATQQQANQKAQEASQALSEAQAANDLATANLVAAQQAPAAANTGAQQLTRIKDAMQMALAAGDITSYGKLADLYNDAYKIYGTDAGKLTTAQQSALDEANNSLSMVDQLENAYKNAGGGQGFVQGNLNEFTNWLTGGNANAALNTYNSLKQSLGTSIVKNVVNLGGTEADAQRYLAMLPSATDTQEQAAQKLNELRTMLNNMKANIGSKQ